MPFHSSPPCRPLMLAKRESNLSLSLSNPLTYALTEIPRVNNMKPAYYPHLQLGKLLYYGKDSVSPFEIRCLSTKRQGLHLCICQRKQACIPYPDRRPHQSLWGLQFHKIGLHPALVPRESHWRWRTSFIHDEWRSATNQDYTVTFILKFLGWAKK